MHKTQQKTQVKARQQQKTIKLAIINYKVHLLFLFACWLLLQQWLQFIKYFLFLYFSFFSLICICQNISTKMRNIKTNDSPFVGLFFLLFFLNICKKGIKFYYFFFHCISHDGYFVRIYK